MQHEQDRMRLEVQDDVGAWLHADKSRLVTLWGSFPVGGFGEAQSIRMAGKDRRQVRAWHRRAEVRCSRVLGNTAASSLVMTDRQSDARARMPLCVRYSPCARLSCATSRRLKANEYPSCPVRSCSCVLYHSTYRARCNHIHAASC
jgi:hypothetical protein